MMDYMDKEMGNIILSLDGRKEVNDNVRIKPDKSGSFDDIVPNIKEMIKRRTKGKNLLCKRNVHKRKYRFL